MICIIIALYIGLSIIIGLLGTNRKFGPWGYFFCSLALTPFVGIIVLAASDKRPKGLKTCPKCSYPHSEQ